MSNPTINKPLFDDAHIKRIEAVLIDALGNPEKIKKISAGRKEFFRRLKAAGSTAEEILNTPSPSDEEAIAIADSMVKVGDIVRSFDFDSRELTGDYASFKEGVVTAITDPATHPHFQDCPRYEIVVTKHMGGGSNYPVADGTKVYPPVNGTPTWTGKVTDGVAVIDSRPLTDAEIASVLWNGRVSFDGKNVSLHTWKTVQISLADLMTLHNLENLETTTVEILVHDEDDGSWEAFFTDVLDYGSGFDFTDRVHPWIAALLAAERLNAAGDANAFSIEKVNVEHNGNVILTVEAW